MGIEEDQESVLNRQVHKEVAKNAKDSSPITTPSYLH